MRKRILDASGHQIFILITSKASEGEDNRKNRNRYLHLHEQFTYFRPRIRFGIEICMNKDIELPGWGARGESRNVFVCSFVSSDQIITNDSSYENRISRRTSENRCLGELVSLMTTLLNTETIFNWNANVPYLHDRFKYEKWFNTWVITWISSWTYEQ